MSEKKNKEKRRKENLLTFDTTVEDAEDVIAADKDVERKTAFQETYKRIEKILPEYFMTQRKKRKTTSGGTSFSQNIVVTPNKVTVHTNENGEKQGIKEELQNENQKERE